MDKTELKRLLKFARDEPIPMAFALGADGKAIVKLDKRKPPRALEKQIKDAAPDSRNHRFGTAAVDQDNPKLVRFTVNKAAGGMARKLVLALKGTGFSKVEIGSEDGAAPERAEDEEAGTDGAEGAANAAGTEAACVARAAQAPGHGPAQTGRAQPGVAHGAAQGASADAAAGSQMARPGEEAPTEKALVPCYSADLDWQSAIKKAVTRLSAMGFRFEDLRGQVREIDVAGWPEYATKVWGDLPDALPPPELVADIVSAGGVFFGPFAGFGRQG